MHASKEGSEHSRFEFELKFDWDEHNLGHLAKHNISSEEVEQAVLNRPVDLGSHLRNGKERIAHVGETDEGRVLNVVSTTRDGRVRVVTAWPANKKYRQYFLAMKRNGNVGRIEEQDLRE
jgi:uncharacterized protein